MAKKNDPFEGVVTGLTDQGLGVTRVDGMAVFLPAACVGDQVSGVLTKVEKRYAYGRILKVLEPSPARVVPKCGLFPRCGGCAYWQMTYEAELKEKERLICDQLQHIGGIQMSCDEMLWDASEGYRNKAIYPIGQEDGRLMAGFYARHSHRIIPCAHTAKETPKCLLQPTVFDEILNAFLALAQARGWSAYESETNKGLLRHLFLRGNAKGQVLVCPIVTGFFEALDLDAVGLAKELAAQFPAVCGVVLNQNKRGDNVLLGDACQTLWGEDTLTDTLCGLTFALSPLSFYQVNRPMAEKLYKKAARFAQPKGKVVLDLYCGAGTIGLTMAKDAKQIIGVETVEAAIQNANQNAARNGVQNARFICADAGKAAQMLADEGLRPDVVILDPPRKGCDLPCLEAVAQMAPERIVMISCNPATAARDIARLQALGYTPKALCGADLFPRTSHVETVALLSRQKVTEHIYIDVNIADLPKTTRTTATYPEIKAYIKDKYGLCVSSLNIAQIKEKHGFEKRENYNKGKEGHRVPKCPPEKEKAIEDAFKHFGML